MFGASGAYPVFGYGRWWTILSAGWLHGGALHILFNMMWVRQLGPAVADIYGAGQMVIIYTVACAAGFLLSSFMGAYLPWIPLLGGGSLTVGASAPIFGSAWRAGLLRTPRRQQHGEIRSAGTTP